MARAPSRQPSHCASRHPMAGQSRENSDSMESTDGGLAMTGADCSGEEGTGPSSTCRADAMVRCTAEDRASAASGSIHCGRSDRSSTHLRLNQTADLSRPIATASRQHSSRRIATLPRDVIGGFRARANRETRRANREPPRNRESRAATHQHRPTRNGRSRSGRARRGASPPSPGRSARPTAPASARSEGRSPASQRRRSPSAPCCAQAGRRTRCLTRLQERQRRPPTATSSSTSDAYE